MTAIYSELNYKRWALSLRKLNILQWTVSKSSLYLEEDIISDFWHYLL